MGKSAENPRVLLNTKNPRWKRHNNAEFLLDNSGSECDINSYLGSGGFFRGAGETATIHEGCTDHRLPEPVGIMVHVEAGRRQWWRCDAHQCAELQLMSAVAGQSGVLHGSFAGS